MQLRKERVIAEQRELVEAGAGRAAGGPAGPYVLVEAAGELPRPARGALGRVGAEVPAPGNFYVNLPPLFLGHFSPIFPVFSPFFRLSLRLAPKIQETGTKTRKNGP